MRVLRQVLGRVKENILHPFNYDQLLMELKKELFANKEQLILAIRIATRSQK